MPKKERGLGRGLDALFNTDNELDNVSELDIKRIIPRTDQPRKKFDKESLQELAQSIKQHGILQPVLVRPRGDKYEIIAGERRWRAAQIAGLTEINVLIKELDDEEAAEISLIENLQRDDLTVIEEALAFKKLIEKHKFTQEKIADRIGRSRPYITNVLRILNLPTEILAMIEEQKLSAGHARALLSLPNDKERIKVARSIVDGKISVRQTEKSVKQKGVSKNNSIEISELEARLQKHFATKAELITRKKGGIIQITYYNDEELERIIELIGME